MTSDARAEHKSIKIRELREALVIAGYPDVPAQARALGLSQGMTSSILQPNPKRTAISAAVIQRMLDQPGLPSSVRAKILEYVDETTEATDNYGQVSLGPAPDDAARSSAGTRRRQSDVKEAPAQDPAHVYVLEKIAELLGGRKILGAHVTTQLEAHDMILKGLPAETVQHLEKNLVVIPVGKRASLEKALGISWRTVQRHKKISQKRLNQEQSGRLWKFAEILAKATEVFGSQGEAEQWMNSPATGLEQRRPIELLETPAGAEIVETFLERLEYGVYS